MVRNALCFDWTDAAIARLKALWAEGLSASEVGKRLGVSRNSVIGKIHRLGLSGKYRRPRERVRRMRAKAKPAQLLEIEQPVSSRPEMPQIRQDIRPGSFDLLELRAGMCRWPEGDRAPYSFCGAPVAFDSSYCRKHYALAHSRGSQKDFDQAAEQALAGKLFASRAGVDEAA